MPRPPRSTRTDTRFPYTTLSRANPACPAIHLAHLGAHWRTTQCGMVRVRRARQFQLPAAVAHPGRKDEDEVRAYRSEAHTSELQSLMRLSYAVLCLKKKNYYKISTSAYKNNRHNIKNQLDS